MLELYHWEPNGAGARVMIALAEKGLKYRSRWVDVLALEQCAPAFLKLSETGQTPVLVHDGEAFIESSYICEYLDEAFPDKPLMPKGPLDRWRARCWQKYVDDHLAAAIGDLAWKVYGRDASDLAGKLPDKARQEVWRRLSRGLDQAQIEKARERVTLAIGKMEQDLAGGDWLAGDACSLADIAVYAYAAYLPKLAPELVSSSAAPRTAAWLARMAARPAVKAALAAGRSSDPFAVTAPGPEHVRWG